MLVGTILSSAALLNSVTYTLSLLGPRGDLLGETPFQLIRCAIFAGLICWFAGCLALRSSWPKWRKLRAVRAGFEVALGTCAVLLCVQSASSPQPQPTWQELLCLFGTGLVLIVIGVRAVSPGRQS
jgi:hypothetical protein